MITRGRQEGDPKASGVRPRDVIGISYFASEDQPGAIIVFWEISAYLSYLFILFLTRCPVV